MTLAVSESLEGRIREEAREKYSPQETKRGAYPINVIDFMRYKRPEKVTQPACTGHFNDFAGTMYDRDFQMPDRMLLGDGTETSYNQLMNMVSEQIPDKYRAIASDIQMATHLLLKMRPYVQAEKTAASYYNGGDVRLNGAVESFFSGKHETVMMNNPWFGPAKTGSKADKIAKEAFIAYGNQNGKLEPHKHALNGKIQSYGKTLFPDRLDVLPSFIASHTGAYIEMVAGVINSNIKRQY